MVGAAIRRRVGVAYTRRVRAELPDIAVHIVETEPVRRECRLTRCRPAKHPGRTPAIGARAVSRTIIEVGGDAHTIAFAAHGAAGPAVICQLGSDGRPDMERAVRAGATCVFP